MTIESPAPPSAESDGQPAPDQDAGREFAMEAIPPQSALVDVMGGAARHEIRVHEHGFIALVDTLPRLVPEGKTADFAVVQAARVSYGQGTKRVNEDRGLIRYLMRNWHTTPFEMIEFKFHVSMPIFVARQWIRHRTANVNEYSARYSVMPDQFYVPALDEIRKQTATNRQGGDEAFAATGEEAATAEQFLDYLDEAEARLYPRYQALLERGLSRELARIGLPISAYTQWYWKCDLYNILHFLELRMDDHAQEEIRVYARAMHDLIAPIAPVTLEAFRDYRLEAMNLSRLELEALRRSIVGGDGALDTKNRRERDEWAAKRERLGLA